MLVCLLNAYFVLISHSLKILRKSCVDTDEWFFVKLILVKKLKCREMHKIVSLAIQFENAIP